ncbi:PAS domain S-box protein [Mucilaginibacter sp.]
MDTPDRLFSSNEILNILSLSPLATAIYTTEKLIIQTANNAMIGYWGKDKSVIGQLFEEAVPELRGQPFLDLLKKVWRTGENYKAVDTAATLRINGELKTSYFDFTYEAIKNEQGEVYCILHTATDVTERNRHQKVIKDSEEPEQQLNNDIVSIHEELTATNEELAISQNDLKELNFQLETKIESRTRALAESENRLKSMVMTSPIGMTILRGYDLVVEIANHQMLEIWNRREDEIVGKKLMDVFPDLVDQPFPEYLKSVLDTGKKVAMPESAVIITKPGNADKLLYVDFSYDPLFDTEGRCVAIMATVIDVSDKVVSRRAIERSEKEQQALNEELSATNEELASANEELITANEELAETQQSLKDILVRLSDSEVKFRASVEQAPVAIGVFSTRDMIIESANEMILQLWGKTSVIIGLPLAIALPELDGQPFLQLLDNVFTSGRTYYGNEAKVSLVRNGILGDYYFDFIYKAIKDSYGDVTSIMVIAVEVTEQMKARNELQKAEQMLRLSLEAANIGTWSIDPETNSLRTTPRLRELFGYDPDKEMTFDEAIAEVTDEYRDKILTEIDNAIKTGGDYDFTYTMRRFNDGKIIWLRSLGKVTNDEAGNMESFSGVVMDITEQKEDELRKNDFIGMVSHELKTPLTSLSAIVQMLAGKARSSNDNFTAVALDKAYTQARRMSSMINGFLNISRLESGKININKQKFKLDELLREMIDETLLTAASHLITLQTVKALTVYADQDKIGSVISNLLSNAVKYSERGTTINVNCSVENNQAIVSVKDTGLGIKPQDIDKIFDRYYRIENNNTRHISGFGIGLYLSAEIVQRHNGKIWVESEIDKGSTFYFSLPLG